LKATTAARCLFESPALGAGAAAVPAAMAACSSASATSAASFSSCKGGGAGHQCHQSPAVTLLSSGVFITILHQLLKASNQPPPLPRRV